MWGTPRSCRISLLSEANSLPTALPAVLVLLLDENHLDALLGEFAGAGDAGKAVAGDDDVAVDFLSELQ